MFDKLNAAPVIRTVGDKIYSFTMLKRKHLAELLSKWIAEDYRDLKQRLKDSGFDKKEIFERLEKFHEETKMSGPLYGHKSLYQLNRTFETVLMSLQLTDPKITDDDLDGLPFVYTELLVIAGELWGLKFDDTKTEKEEKKDENPTK